MRSREESKRLTLRCRERTKELLQVSSMPLRVQPHAPVQLMEDGAFIEVTLWVPLAVIEGAEKE